MNDSDIVKGIKAGDKNAFDELYEKYHLQLYRTAYLLLKNPYDAEDVIQETFLSIYKNIKNLRNEEKVKPWMYSILKNESYKSIKKRNKELPEEEILSKMDYSTDFVKKEDIMHDNEINEILKKLNSKQKEAIVLYYYNGFSIKEISQITKSFQGTIKSRLYYAKKILKKELQDNQIYYNSIERGEIHEQ